MPKNTRRGGAAALLIAAVVALGGCAGSQDAASGDDRPVVLTTFTVLADIAQNVAGEHLRVESITKVGAEIHGYEPTPRDVARAADADLILDNGLNLELWFGQFVESVDVPHVVVSDGIDVIDITEDAYAGTPNPHAWMSPVNAQAYVEAMVDAFSELDPAHAAEFAANGDDYRAELQAVNDDLRAALGALPDNQRALVTCEGAFSYLARDAGLTEQYIWPVNAEQQATPQQIARTIEFVRDNDVPGVFCESTVSDKPMQQIVEATGARFGGTLYVDSLSEPDGPVPTYLDLLRHDAETIVAGLTGGAPVTAAIEVRGVSVRYGDIAALDDVTLDVAAGRVTGLIGTNGSGKSTLFKAVMGIVRPDRGTVLLDGLAPAVARRRGLLGYVPQAEDVDWTFPVSVHDVVMMGRYGHLGFTRRPRTADRDAVAAALARVDLAELQSRQIGQLSGGQRKRAFVARGIAQDAGILLLDEPFAGVDKPSEALIRRLLRELAGEGRTVLVSTHDLHELPRLADEAILLQRRVLAQGTVAHVLAPENLALAFGTDVEDDDA